MTFVSFEEDPTGVIVSLCKHFGHDGVRAASGDVIHAIFGAAEWATLVFSHATPKGCFVVPDCAVTVHQAVSSSPKCNVGIAHEFCADICVCVRLNILPSPKIGTVLVTIAVIIRSLDDNLAHRRVVTGLT